MLASVFSLGDLSAISVVVNVTKTKEALCSRYYCFYLLQSL
ncbi:Uncharacterised protein [Vibrio cholerae]|nr:Uncharacterised protein [Vibrio cholerae]